MDLWSHPSVLNFSTHPPGTAPAHPVHCNVFDVRSVSQNRGSDVLILLLDVGAAIKPSFDMKVPGPGYILHQDFEVQFCKGIINLIT